MYVKYVFMTYSIELGDVEKRYMEVGGRWELYLQSVLTLWTHSVLTL